MSLFRSIAAALAILTTVPAVAAAQLSRSDFEVVFEARETQRRAIVAKVLSLTEEEAENFWPLYDEYRYQAKGQQLQLVKNVAVFAENFETLDANLAEDLLSGAVEQQDARNKTQSEHIKRVQKVLPPIKALRYLQLDGIIETAQEFQLRREIPLAGSDLEAMMMGASSPASGDSQ